MNNKIEKIIFKFFDNQASLSELHSLLSWINNEENYIKAGCFVLGNPLRMLDKIEVPENIIKEINYTKKNREEKIIIKKRALIYTNAVYVVCSLFIFINFKLGVKSGKKRIWNFIAPKVHDFTWAADPDYNHDIYQGANGVQLNFYYKNDPEIIDNWKYYQCSLWKSF